MKMIQVERPKKKRESLALSGALNNSRTKKQPKSPSIGSKVGGYTLVERVGAGGFGEVFRGEKNGGVAAFKFPHDRLDPSVVKSLRNEAKAAKRLDHPNIVVPEKVVDARTGLYLQMPYVDAEPLDVTVERSAYECLDIIENIGTTLAYAHSQGVVHQDVKPENVLIDESGNVYIVDLGLARVKKEQEVKQSMETNRRSLTGPVGGTLDYMSPEQKNGGEVDQRADVYGLAVLLYKMLTKGKSPAGSVKKELMRHDVPEHIAQTIADGGITQKEDRYSSINEFLSNLAEPDENLGIRIEGTSGWWVNAFMNSPRQGFAFFKYRNKDFNLQIQYAYHGDDCRQVTIEGTDLDSVHGGRDPSNNVHLGIFWERSGKKATAQEEILKYKEILEELPRQFESNGLKVDFENGIERILKTAEKLAEEEVIVEDIPEEKPSYLSKVWKSAAQIAGLASLSLASVVGSISIPITQGIPETDKSAEALGAVLLVSAVCLVGSGLTAILPWRNLCENYRKHIDTKSRDVNPKFAYGHREFYLTPEQREMLGRTGGLEDHFSDYLLYRNKDGECFYILKDENKRVYLTERDFIKLGKVEKVEGLKKFILKSRYHQEINGGFADWDL